MNQNKPFGTPQNRMRKSTLTWRNQATTKRNNWSEEEKGIYTSPNSWLNSVDSMKILAKVFDESIAKMILCVPLLPASLTSAD